MHWSIAFGLYLVHRQWNFYSQWYVQLLHRTCLDWRKSHWICEILGSHGSKYEDGCLMDCCAGYSGRRLPTFQMCLLPPSSYLMMEASNASEASVNFTRLHGASTQKTAIPTEIISGHNYERFRINVWASVVGDEFVRRSLLLPARLTGRRYRNFPQITLPTMLEDAPLLTR
jgi:hypothetical protein